MPNNSPKEESKPSYFDWLARVWHRPISVIVESTRKMPDVRKLPQIVYLTVNLKGNRETGQQLIDEIKAQIEKENFFAVEVTGRSK